MPGPIRVAAGDEKLREGPIEPHDIGVSMRREVLEHKKRDGMSEDGAYCYWEMGRGVPEDVGEGSKLWVACGGSWVGYFVLFNTTIDELWFHSETWHAAPPEIIAPPRPPFQGFTRKVPVVAGA